MMIKAPLLPKHHLSQPFLDSESSSASSTPASHRQLDVVQDGRRRGDVAAPLSSIVSILALSTVASAVMFSYSLVYARIIQAGDFDPDDKAGIWAGDALLSLTALLFAFSSKYVVYDQFLIFYLGTAVAYGLGGVGHFLQDCTGPTGLTAYYISMTLAFSGDAVRSTFGYGLGPSPRLTALRMCTALALLTMIFVASANVEMLARGYQAEEVRASPSGLAYEAAQLGMGLCEIGGSLTWYAETRRQTGVWGAIATVANVSNWMLLQFEPWLLVEPWGYATNSVAHRLSHYLQCLLMWILHSLSIKVAFEER